MGKQPPCWDGELKIYHSDAECSYLPRGTYTDYEGWLYAFQSSQTNITPKWKTQSMRSCSFKQWGVYIQTPETLYLTIITDSRCLLQTDSDSCKNKKTYIIVKS